MRTSLNQEFIPPAIQRLETLRIVDIVHKNTAVSTTIERDTQRLKALLTSRIPDLIKSRKKVRLAPSRAWCRLEDKTYLHCYQTVIDKDLFGEEVRTDGSFVACAELLVDLWDEGSVEQVLGRD